jgi:hypothetical protein
MESLDHASDRVAESEQQPRQNTVQILENSQWSRFVFEESRLRARAEGIGYTRANFYQASSGVTEKVGEKDSEESPSLPNPSRFLKFDSRNCQRIGQALFNITSIIAPVQQKQSDRQQTDRKPKHPRSINIIGNKPAAPPSTATKHRDGKTLNSFLFV